MLRCRTSGSSEKALKDPATGLVIDGFSPGADAKKGIVYRPVKGDNTILVPQTAFVIQALALTWDVSLVEDLVGKTNLNPIFFGQGPTDTVMFLGADAVMPLSAEGPASCWQVTLNFLKDRRKWTDMMYVGKFERVLVNKEIFNSSGDSFNPKRYGNVCLLRPVTGASDEVRVMRSSVDFSVFNKMLTL